MGRALEAEAADVERFEADREDEEAEWVARQIEALVAGRGASGSVLARRADKGDDDVYRRQDLAVMYRTNAQSRPLEEAFLRYGLPYQLVGGTRFYQRREVKDALAYLRIAADPGRITRADLRATVRRPSTRPRSSCSPPRTPRRPAPSPTSSPRRSGSSTSARSAR